MKRILADPFFMHHPHPFTTHLFLSFTPFIGRLRDPNPATIAFPSDSIVAHPPDNWDFQNTMASSDSMHE
jgi:hypothetical protein